MTDQFNCGLPWPLVKPWLNDDVEVAGCSAAPVTWPSLTGVFSPLDGLPLESRQIVTQLRSVVSSSPTLKPSETAEVRFAASTTSQLKTTWFGTLPLQKHPRFEAILFLHAAKPLICSKVTILRPLKNHFFDP